MGGKGGGEEREPDGGGKGRDLIGVAKAICGNIRVRVCHHSRTSVTPVNISLALLFLSLSLSLSPSLSLSFP